MHQVILMLLALALNKSTKSNRALNMKNFAAQNAIVAFRSIFE
jgi:hypothetical protein